MFYSQPCLTWPEYVSVFLNSSQTRMNLLHSSPFCRWCISITSIFHNGKMKYGKINVKYLHNFDCSETYNRDFFRDCLKYRWYIDFTCAYESSALLQIRLRFSRWIPQNKKHENEWLLMKNLFYLTGSSSDRKYAVAKETPLVHQGSIQLSEYEALFFSIS